MKYRRQIAIGLLMLLGGLMVVAAGATFPSSDPLVALGWLLFLPLVVAFCGCALIVIGLARSLRSAGRSAVILKILGIAAVAALGLALGFGALGIV